MAFEKWQLSHDPCEKDPDRWKLKLKIDEDTLDSLVVSVPGNIGRPFVLDNDPEGFNYEILLYEIKDKGFKGLYRLIKSKCGSGDVVLEGANGRIKKIVEEIYAEEKDAEAQRERAKKKRDTGANASLSEFDDIMLNPSYTFEEFVIGPNNRFTAAAAQAVAENPSKIYNPFFIYGGVGLGKTHLMNAIGHHIRKKNSDAQVMYVTTEKFMTDVIDSIRSGSLKKMRDHYRKLDLLLVDDIQFLEESESTQEEFFHTFNVLHQNGRQIVITCDRPPKQLTTLEDRLRSRFEWGLIADIKSPNLETRVAILKKKGEIAHVNLDDNILLYIASKLKSNIRELEGFLKRINAYASLTHQEVNMELVRTIMSDLLPEEESEAQGQEGAKSQESKVYVIKSPEQQASAQGHSHAPSPAPPQPPQVVPPPMPRVEAENPKEISEKDIVVLHKKQENAVPPTLTEADQQDPNLKRVEVGFFFPETKHEELGKVKERFREVIKKHKLKFQLKGVFEHPYSVTDKVNYEAFTELSEKNNIKIAIVLGPSSDANIDPEDFSNILASMMDEKQISLQLIPWAELNKDYRYLNLALDITLLKHHT
jgi:chromosomal replication initiator protein DnaA